MPVISEESAPDLFRLVSDRNLQHQYYLLETMVILGLKIPDTRLTQEIVCELNRAAVRFLAFNPGRYRDDFVSITRSEHEPPHWNDVPRLMQECFDYLGANWTRSTPTHLAAYALWRLSWIHPFEEGNGRTARAACYFVLCIKHARWLPGRRTILGQIRQNPRPYYGALRTADEHYRDGDRLELSGMEEYLDRLLTRQLNS